jgi:hypothetical protein
MSGPRHGVDVAFPPFSELGLRDPSLQRHAGVAFSCSTVGFRVARRSGLGTGNSGEGSVAPLCEPPQRHGGILPDGLDVRLRRTEDLRVFRSQSRQKVSSLPVFHPAQLAGRQTVHAAGERHRGRRQHHRQGDCGWTEHRTSVSGLGPGVKVRSPPVADIRVRLHAAALLGWASQRPLPSASDPS